MEIATKLEKNGYRIVESSDVLCRAEKSHNEIIQSEINTSLQDIDGARFFVQGRLLVKELIGAESYWIHAVGQEIGPNVMYIENCHCAGGWPIANETEASNAIEEFLLPWLEKHGEIDCLIKLLENHFFEGIKYPVRKPPSRIGKTILRELGLFGGNGQQEQVYPAPSSAHLLANLYFHIDDADRAAVYANRWIEHRGRANVENQYLVIARGI